MFLGRSLIAHDPVKKKKWLSTEQREFQKQRASIFSARHGDRSKLRRK